MNIQRFIAPTSREALAKARLAFGDGTLILSNRQTADGVEVMATTEDTLSALDLAPGQARTRPQARPVVMHRPPQAPSPVMPDESSNGVAEDAAQLSMSTLSFQDYVRERMLRRRHEAMTASTQLHEDGPPPAPAAAKEKPLVPASWNATAPKKLPPQKSMRAAPAESVAASNVAQELLAMKTMIEDRFNTLNWLGQARQHPIQSNLMLKLIRAGFSPTLSRAILEKLPEDLGAPEAMRWVMDVLERNLRTDADTHTLHEDGGIYALVGATGVGKTTTAAKLAGLCAQTYGPASVGLITLDTYRVGAHEQLRAYGRMMGVVAHLAHDRPALQDLLGLLAGKKMVLIDTAGVAPRDPRKSDMLDVLALPRIQRLLVVNAGSHGDTLDDVVSSFKGSGAQQAILSKVDEAVKLGPVLDATIRHQLVLRGVTTGQRVPEDWDSAHASALVKQAMRAPVKSAFDPAIADLGFVFNDTSSKPQSAALINA